MCVIAEIIGYVNIYSCYCNWEIRRESSAVCLSMEGEPNVNFHSVMFGLNYLF